MPILAENLKNAVYVITQKLLLSAAYIIFFLFSDTTFNGKENIKKIPKGPLLIIANHKSSLDPLLVGMCFPFISRIFPLRFIAKDDFFNNPLTRPVFKSLGTYPVFSGQGLEKSLNMPAAILKRNGTVVFFPEGKRSYTESLGSARVGVAVLAKAFPQATILPIAIAGLHQLGKWGIFSPRLALQIAIGQPFRAGDISSNTEAETVKDKLMEKIESLYYPLLKNSQRDA
jgi:1-acyl-sn-glycerol-3-phosphate acyltransferase